MKTVTLLVVVLVVGASGFLIKVPTVPTRPRTGPVGWVHLQKLILPLFENVCEESVNPIVVRLAGEFSSDSTSGVYLKPEVLTSLQSLKAKGLLPKGEIFTDYNTDHLNELKIIYEVFVYAKDFDTFYKAACWARQNVNCGLFVRAIYLAVINRRDTEKLSVPAPYELLPNYFIEKYVIGKASALLAGEEIVPTDSVRNEGNSYVLDANYTATYIDNNDESKLAYFHEDIGLNTYYFLQKLKKAPWFNTPSDLSIRYGEYLYHMMKQLNARYSLERYANGLPDVESINLDEFTAIPYDPMLIYSNGNDFGHRTISVDLVNAENVQILRSVKSSIKSAVTHMSATGYNKTQILNYLMDNLVTGERSFETLLRAAVGKDDTFSLSQPSVLGHYMSSLRDPIFWRINKKIVDLVDDALKEIPVYTRNELYFPGVEVLNIDVKKVMTNFDYFQFDVTDALKTESTDTIFQVKIGQQRLNHKPFAVKLNISSLVTQKGLVKIYLGQKAAPGELILKKNLFMLLDSFEWNFKEGSNVISRSSTEMTNYSEDFISLKTFRKNIEDAEFGLDALPLKNVESILGFPQRLILPKGTPDGLPLQIFVFVAPYIKSTFGGVSSIPNVEFNAATLSPGYPLDLDIYNSQVFDLPNAMVKDVYVTHKGDKPSSSGGAGGTKNWSKGGYDPSSRPEFDTVKREPFDYTEKKAQYGRKEEAYVKQEDYASKREYIKGGSDNEEHEPMPMSSDFSEDTPVGNMNIEDKKKDSDQIDLQPQYAALRKEPFDYTAKKGQYGRKQGPYLKKEDYASKREYYKSKNGSYKKDFDSTTTNVSEDTLVGKIDVEDGQDKNDNDQNEIDFAELTPLHLDLSLQPEYAPLRREPSDYTAKKAQYGKKEGTYRKKEDYASKREYYKQKGSGKNKEQGIMPSKIDVLEDTSLGKMNIEDFNNEMKTDFVVFTPLQETTYVLNLDESEDNDFASVPKIYTRKPTVYDYIVRPEDYYDEVDIDNRVYE